MSTDIISITDDCIGCGSCSNVCPRYIFDIVNKKAVITNVDGYRIKGKHNYSPSHAVDFRAYVPGKEGVTWDSVHLTYIAASLVMVAEMLYLEGLISHKLRWGGNWDKDGDLADNKLVDRPHVEIYEP